MKRLMCFIITCILMSGITLTVFGSDTDPTIDDSQLSSINNTLEINEETESMFNWYNDITDVWTEECSLVYVNVCVTDEDGDYVRNLQLENFEFFENDSVVYPPNLRQLNECPAETFLVDMVMFFDLSVSMDDEISTLRDNITRFIDALGDEIDFRIYYWTYNGCPRESFPTDPCANGVRELFRTDLTDPLCTYSETAPDIFATTSEDAQCLFDAGFNHFYFLDPCFRGSGHEDQYGMIAEACTTMTFRDGAKKAFLLFTDEEPIFSEYCEPSFGPDEIDDPDSDLIDLIDLMRTWEVEVYNITPDTASFEYMASESPDRGIYHGYKALSDSTGGAWFDLYSDDYSELVDSIAEVISLEPCCYSFVYSAVTFCDSFVDLTVNSTDGTYLGEDDTVYWGLCPPTFELLIPEFTGGITTCEYQEISLRLSNEFFGNLVPETVSFAVNENFYTVDDMELNIEGNYITYIPRIPAEHGDTIVWFVALAMNEQFCYNYTEPCSIFVDLEAPTCFDNYPAEGDSFIQMVDSISFRITDDFSGVNYDSVDVSDISILVEGDTVTFDTITIIDNLILINNPSYPHDGEVTVCINDLLDSPDYDYCPPNNGSCCFNYVIRLEPRTLFFPDTIEQPCDTILIPMYIDRIGPHPIGSTVIQIEFNPDVCIPINIVLEDSYTEGWSIDYMNLDPLSGIGSFRISGEEIEAAEEGIFLFVEAYIPCLAYGGDYCPLQITDARFNTNNIPPALWEDGFMLVDWRVDTWICELRLNRIENPSDEDHVLAIGGSPISTVGYDPGGDLQILPTIPSLVDAHIALSDEEYPWMTELRRDLRDLEPPHRWLIPTFGETNAYIKWNPDVLPEGKFYINGLIDMALDSIAYFGLDDTIVIDWVTPPLGIDMVCMEPGWNMVSLPVQPPRYTTREVFNHTPVGVYSFKTAERRYVESELFKKGEAYWCYSPNDTCLKIGGIILDEYSRIVERGWNMIGSIGDTVDISTICSEPGDCIVGSIYAYDNSLGYYAVTELVPGVGYWALSVGNAILSVPSGSIYCKSLEYSIDSDGLGMFYLDSGEELEFGVNSMALSDLDLLDNALPPVAPEQNKKINGFLRDNIYLNRDIADYPVWTLQINEGNRLSVERMPVGYTELEIIDMNGTKNTIRKGQLCELGKGTYIVRANNVELPKLQSLGAFPNPFNGAVNVSFYIEDDAEVQISIYDMKGHCVDEVINDKMSAGINSVTWDCKNANNKALPGGIYLYRITSGEDVISGKVIYMK